MRRFTLLNERQQHVAKVLFFFEQPLNQYVGIILNLNDSNYTQWLYANDIDIDGIVRDLAQRLNVKYSTYIESF